MTIFIIFSSQKTRGRVAANLILSNLNKNFIFLYKMKMYIVFDIV